VHDQVSEPVPIILAAYDAQWPAVYRACATRIAGALGTKAIRLEHVGSTAVPELAAKPVIDIALVVIDSADEPAYAPDLERVGFGFVVREPAWYEHRLFRGVDAASNVHVFSSGCEEFMRMLLLRDWLRTHEVERRLYEDTKRELAGRRWTSVDEYAKAKSRVVRSILARAQAAQNAV